MNQPTPQDKLELARQISQLMDDFFTAKQCMTDEDVLLLTLHARMEVTARKHLLSTTGY
jgi:DNA polymerase II large subunit